MPAEITSHMTTSHPNTAVNRRIIFLSTGTALLFTVLLLVFATCQYETTDDMTMIRLLAGKNGLTATPDAVFLSLPLGVVLYKLYQITGNVPWYGLFLYGCLITGCAVGLRIILSSETAIYNKISCGIVFLGFYSYLACQLNFAGVSLFLWLTTVAAVISANLREDHSHGVFLLHGILLAVSFLIRPDIFTVAFIFSTPAIATFLIPGTRKYLPAIIIPLLFAFAIASYENHISRSSSEYHEYAKFNQSRKPLHNLHIGAPTSKTIEALALSGWSIYDYILAGDWWLHDSNIYNTATLSSFTKHNSTSLTDLFSPHASIQTFNSFMMPTTITVLCLLQTFFSRRFTLGLKGFQRYAILSSILITLGAVLLMSGIRFPARIAMPVFAYLVLLGICFSPLSKERQFPYTVIHTSIAGIFIIAVAICTFFMSHEDYKKRLMALQIKSFTDSTLQQVITNCRPDTIMVTANVLAYSFISEVTHPLREFRDSLPIIDLPNNWLIASPPYNNFLQKNGFGDRSQAVPRMIDNDRVIFSYWQAPTENYDLFINNFLEHLKNRYSMDFPGKTFQVETILDNRGVKGNFGWIFFRIRAI